MNPKPPTIPQKRRAIILMNLGGPDKEGAIQPFLYNLFSDPAILSFPSYVNPVAPLLRRILAKIISKGRAKKARQIYKVIGGRSPLVENTERQAYALQMLLNQSNQDIDSRVFIAMRYWHPFTQETVQAVEKYNPHQLVLLPLYPQYSGTTSGSSIHEWDKWWSKTKTPISPLKICCYGTEDGFISAYRDLILSELEKVPKGQKVRLLFSAHGLPQRNIDQGDPYQWQVEQSVQAILGTLGESIPKETESIVCYQSKVGRLKWLSPSLEDEINRAVIDNVGVVIIPISFVSEHSETLVELDVDFKNKSHNLGIPYYGRVPTVSDHQLFIKGLANLIESYGQSDALCNCWCPDKYSQCGHSPLIS